MSKTDLMQQDMNSRESIVSDTGTNFFVEAGAGSGKTTMLVRRMVAMVEAGIDVSRICAITFTKAAAGEFYERFQALLAKRSTEPTRENPKREPGELQNPTDVTRKRCAEALQNIDLCFMGTIDSFCSMVLSEHPTEAMVPSDIVNISEEAKDVFLREYTRIGGGVYGDELKRQQQAFRRLNGFKSKEAFLEGINTVFERRHTEIILPECPESVADLLDGEKEEILAVLRILNDHPEAAYPTTNDNLAAWADLSDSLKTLDDEWEDDIDAVSKALGSIYNLRICLEWMNNYGDLLGRHADIIEEGLSRNKLAWYRFDQDRINRVISRLENFRYTQSMRFLIAASDVIAEECRKRGELTFFDYLLYLRDMLKTDAEHGGKLIQHIYNRHSYFLIDEFQDTNPLQAEVFFYLTAQNPVPNWRECVPKPGSLFIVGDPKQSIYRFRSADVAAFLKVKAMFTGEVGQVLYLTRNFRSTYRMRKWFNSTFATMLSRETEEQSRFEEIPLEEEPADDGTFSGVYSYNAWFGKDVPDEKTDPVVIAGIIARLVGNPAYLLPEGSGSRTIRYSDFMLITPTKTRLAEYMKVFTENGIPFYVEGRTVFKECPALIEIVKLFDVFAKPGDRHALYKALIGKTLNYHRTQLAKCCNLSYPLENGETRFFALNVFTNNSPILEIEGGEVAAPLVETLQDLGRLTRQAGGMTSAALFRKVLDTYPVLERAGASNLEYVWFALELLRSKELSGEIASLKDGSKFLNELINDESELERCLSLRMDADRVHLANLHKVKGLEAPIVFLAWPSTRGRKPDLRTEQGEPRPKTWIFRLPNRETFNAAFFDTDAFEDEMTREQSSMDQEMLRLLYVAATRAKSVLFVGNPEIQARGNKNYWQDFLDVVEGRWESLPEGTPQELKERETVSIAELYDEAGAEDSLRTDSVRKTYEIVRPSAVKVKGRSEAEEEYLEEADGGDKASAGTGEDVAAADPAGGTAARKVKGRPDATVIGTMVHRVMEVLVSSRNQVDAAALIKETVDEYGYEFAERTGEYTLILNGVIDTVRNGGYPQETGTPQDILGELLSADEVYCEVPFAIRTDAEETAGSGSVKFTITNGVIDVLYRKGSAWHIIDYKTNAETEGLAERYEPQLQAYIRAVKETTGCEADARVYHVEV